MTLLRARLPALLVLALLSGCGDPGRMFLHPRLEIIDTPRSFAAAWEEVRLPRADGRFTPAWWLPNDASDAIVVIYGGNSGNRSHQLAYARVAHDAGFSVLIPDYQGFGPDNGDVSLDALPLDGEAAVAWAGRRSRRVGVWGISLGSAVALGAAARRPDVVDAVCVEGSFRLGPAVRHYMGFALPAVLAAPLGALVTEFVVSPESDPERNLAARRAGVPVLFVHGDRDRLTKTVWAAQMFEATRGPKELWLLDDTGHAPEPLRSCDGAYAEHVGGFFRRALLGERRPQAWAVWEARPAGAGWEVEAAVGCEGPFPAAVEVVAVADGEVARRRIWMDGPRATVVLTLDRRPATAAARRHERVRRTGRSWRPDETPVAASYRALLRLKRLEHPPLADLLALEVAPPLAADLARFLCRAAESASPSAARQLCLRALEVAPAQPGAWILGDASYWDPAPWTRPALADSLRALFAEKGWDPAPLEATMQRVRSRE